MQVDSLPAEPQGKPKNTGVGSLSLLQQIFLTQEFNWGLLHCRWILYQLSYQGRESRGEDQLIKGFPGGASGKESRDSRDVDSILGSGRFPGVETGNPLQYSCLENPWTEKPVGLTVCGFTKADATDLLSATKKTTHPPSPLFSSVQLLTHVQLCDPMDCSTPGFPVHHQLLELAQTHVS